MSCAKGSCMLNAKYKINNRIMKFYIILIPIPPVTYSIKLFGTTSISHILHDNVGFRLIQLFIIIINTKVVVRTPFLN